MNKCAPTLAFYGGVGTVTGSKYMIRALGKQILIDCGIFQGLKPLRDRNWQDPPFHPADIDAVVLTHAHIDHTGYLPRLVKLGYRGPIYCSEGTARLLEILLPDSGRLQEEDSDHRNRHGLTRHQPALPLYTEQNAFDALRQLRTLPTDNEQLIIPCDNGQRISVKMMNAGHIIGSRFVLLDIQTSNTNKVSVLFSGDLGQYDRPILPDPSPPPACDYLLVESTYGDRLHPQEPPETALARIILEAAKRDAPILIPAFAVDRTQEIIYILRELEEKKRIPVLPVTVDSPMAQKATEVYARLRSEQDAQYRSVATSHRPPLSTHRMVVANSREDSKKLNELRGAQIIISAAGMMTGGRILHHAQRILPDRNATLIFVGFQAEGTTGRLIRDGASEVTIYKTRCAVRCHMATVDGLSSHADWRDTLRWLSGVRSAPKKVFVTHGEPSASAALKLHIEEQFRWHVETPAFGDTQELTTGYGECPIA